MKKRQQVLADLEGRMRGQVTSHTDYRKFYSVDASSYQVVPDIIAYPRDERDVVAAIEVAGEHRVPVTARGAGTGLVGSALNRGIILDMGAFGSVRVAKRHATVGAGVPKGRLDMRLEEKGKFFAPNPSVGSFCSVGGMLGNNSSGSRSLKYGSVIDNLEEVTLVDGNGRKVTLPGDREVAEKVMDIAGKADMDSFPKVTKNSSGYRLDAVRTRRDAHKVIAGSEGTLGVILSAKLRTREKPRERVLLVMEYGSTRHAAENCIAIGQTCPSAIEFVDRTTLAHIRHTFSSGSECLLFVEYDEDTAARERELRGVTTGRIAKRADTDDEIARWWMYRDSSLHYSLRSMRDGNMFPHVIEDAAVPPGRLPDLFAALEGINRKFGTRSISYGHAGNGNIHVRLVSDKKGTAMVKGVADEYFGKIMGLGGTITAEHGDGLARSEYVRRQYGARNHRAFRELKSFFDPKGIMNPGKVMSRGSTVAKHLQGHE